MTHNFCTLQKKWVQGNQNLIFSVQTKHVHTAHTHARTHAHTHTHVRTHTHTHTYTHTHSHTHTHTHCYAFNIHLSSPPVDFVLKDPRAKDQEAPYSQLPHRRELDVVPKPWNRSFSAAHVAMSELLFVTNPTLNSVLNLWHRNYGALRLVSSKGLVTHEKVFELAAYQNLVVKENERVRNVLLKK